MPLMPKQGTLERVFLEKLVQKPEGATYLDFVGTGITEDNIEQIASNLRNGMFESESDDILRQDA